MDRDNSFQTYEKKRYAYLEVGNVGNSRLFRGKSVIGFSRYSVGCYYHTLNKGYSYDLRLRTWHLQFHASWFKLKGTQGSCKTQFSFIMEIIFIGIAVILGIWLLFHAAIYLWVLFEEYVLPILIFCGVGSFFFWLIFWIFGIKEIFGISTMIIGAVIGFILWIWITFFGDNGGHSDYEHEDMDHDMPIHVKIDN